MSESSCIDSPLRGRAMPRSYSGDLRERVIEAVEGGASRRETAERFEVSVSSAVCHSSVRANVPTISRMQAMLQYDRNPL